jgi:glutathione S-transferase
MERYHLMEWLNFISTELHKSFGALFNPQTPDAWKTFVHGLLGQRFDFVSAQLADRDYLLGDDFTVPDAYLFTVLNWGQWTGVDIGKWPTLKTYSARIAGRPAVRAALVAEKLLKE